MTSNVGSEEILELGKKKGAIGFEDADEEKSADETLHDRVMHLLRQSFKPEFLNRIDDTVVFHALKPEHLTKIVDVQLARVQERLNSKHITLEVSATAKKWLVEKGYDPSFGARPLKRLIQDVILNKLALQILEGTVKEESTIKVGVRDGEITVG
jgi:ATP-dependent Clp protease ATP-binding subunit ClpB